MNAKNLMVSFVMVACALFLVASVSAYTDFTVEVDGVNVDANDVSVVAGETVTVKVWFTSEANDTDVTVEAEIEGDKVDTEAETSRFDVEDSMKYKKVLTLDIPYELKDDLSDFVELTITVDGQDTKDTYVRNLKVQRPNYNAAIKSITVANSVDAGQTVPVEFVIKNRGYNDLDDLYVTLSIPALGVSKTTYADDLVKIEDCDDDCDKDDTLSGKLYVTIPYNAAAGIYAVEVEVSNDDTTSTAVKQIVVNNDFSNNVVVTSTSKAVSTGANAEFELILVNPTNKLKVFRVISESGEDFTSSVDNSVVAVSAGSSRTVTVVANAAASGTHTFNVNVFSGEKLESTSELTMNASGSSVASPVVILAVILSIVFIVLLIVLVVLITKKPAKEEEFGESYY